jgi:Ca2+-binding RTX toxin-like protein
VFVGPGGDSVGGVGPRSPGNDLYFLGRGNDQVTDGPGNDVYHGEGADFDSFSLQGGGFDRLFGGDDDLLFWNGRAGMRINLRTGKVVRLADDTLRATVSSINDVDGGDGMDILIGNGADNVLFGGFGNDRIFGRGGDDHLRGEGGDDFLDGESETTCSPARTERTRASTASSSSTARPSATDTSCVRLLVSANRGYACLVSGLEDFDRYVEEHGI